MLDFYLKNDLNMPVHLLHKHTIYTPYYKNIGMILWQVPVGSHKTTQYMGIHWFRAWINNLNPVLSVGYNGG